MRSDNRVSFKRLGLAILNKYNIIAYMAYTVDIGCDNSSSAYATHRPIILFLVVGLNLTIEA